VNPFFAFLASTGLFASVSAATEHVLWDHWYTVSGRAGVHYAIYNEKVTADGDRVHVQTQLWKREEDQITQENLGAFATNDDSLTPLFFNFRSAYGSSVTELDATFKRGDQGVELQVKGRRSGEPISVQRRAGISGAFLSSFFPVWLKKRAAKIKVNQTQSFQVIFEDDWAGGFVSVTGHLWRQPLTAEDQKTNLTPFKLDYRGSTALWWIRPDGAAEQIKNKDQGSLVRISTRKDAEAFLGINK
jgi:hypothetical protein